MKINGIELEVVPLFVSFNDRMKVEDQIKSKNVLIESKGKYIFCNNNNGILTEYKTLVTIVLKRGDYYYPLPKGVI